MGPEFQRIEAFVAAARASPPSPAGPGDDAALLPPVEGRGLRHGRCGRGRGPLPAREQPARRRRPQGAGGEPLRPRGDGRAAALGAGRAGSPTRLLGPRRARAGEGVRCAGARNRDGAGRRKRDPCFRAVADRDGRWRGGARAGAASLGRAPGRRGVGLRDAGGCAARAGAARAPRRPRGEAPSAPPAPHPRGGRPSASSLARGSSSGAALVGVASACIDLSDGLVQDAGHLADASRVALHLVLEALPCSAALIAAVPDPSARARTAAAGGEDYELLFTTPASRRSAVQRLARRLGLPLTPIGEVRSRARGPRGGRPGRPAPRLRPPGLTRGSDEVPHEVPNTSFDSCLAGNQALGHVQAEVPLEGALEDTS